jgi:hypothetical protein
LSDHFAAQFQEMELELNRLRSGATGETGSAPPEVVRELQNQLRAMESAANQWRERCEEQERTAGELERERRRLKQELDQLGDVESKAKRLQDELKNALLRIDEFERHRPEIPVMPPPIPADAPLKAGATQIQELLAVLPEPWRSNPAALKARLTRLQELEEDVRDLRNKNIQLSQQIYQLKQSGKRV